VLLCLRGVYPQVIEEVAESADEFVESSELLDRLIELKKQPVDLSVASVQELLRLPWLTRLMAEEIVRYRETKGGIRHLSELRSLLGFDWALIERMSEFVIVGVAKKVERGVRVEERWRLQWPAGNASDYPGDRNKLYGRSRISFRERYFVGFLVEKDAYEEQYIDYTSYFFQAIGMGPLRKMVAGYYDLEFGQGLLFSPMEFSVKSGGAIEGGDRGILPSRSSDENRALRGGAFALGVGRLDVLGFLSMRSLDAHIDDEGKVISLYETGLHRNEQELMKKDAITEKLIGGRVQGSGRGVSGGITLVRGEYSNPFDVPSFSGSGYSLMSGDVEARLNRTRFFGEGALSSEGGSGLLLGARVSVRRFSTGLMFRHYSDDFWSPHSSGFSEYDDQNERGMYCFAGFSTEKGTRVEAYFDMFRRLKPGAAGEFSDRGDELQVSVRQKISRLLSGEVRYRRKEKRERLRESLRLELDLEMGRLATRARLEFSRAGIGGANETETGEMEYLNVKYSPWEWMELEGRVSFFSIDSYDCRVYTYERDLPGYLRNVALFGDGQRYYLLVQCTPMSWLELTLKYGREKREEVREEFGLQLDLVGFL